MEYIEIRMSFNSTSYTQSGKCDLAVDDINEDLTENMEIK